MLQKTVTEIEYGDFQTPKVLAEQVCQLLRKLSLNPRSIIEPNCGQGNLFFQALDTFQDVERAVGLEVSPIYIAAAKSHASAWTYRDKITFIQEDFFKANWPEIVDDLPEPILVIGNPPWITSSHVAALGGFNVPEKSNFQSHSGLDAKTGKSNFDISEWMLGRCLDCLNGRNGEMAMLCKTSVARKLLDHAHKNDISLGQCKIYHIDALKHFGAAVDACLFFCRIGSMDHNYDCSIYSSIDSPYPDRIIGYRDGFLVSRVALYEKWKKLRGTGYYKWRSGIKHDCSKVMELTREGDRYRNGLGERIEIEDQYLYPMLKTSEVAKLSATPTRYMLVTQQTVGEETATIQGTAPLTWAYLESHAHLFEKRGSVIYKNRPRFSVFGVGDYSFAPWKVAISGFYKRLQFKVVGPVAGKGVVLDDSSYFVPCQSEGEAALVAKLLNSTPASEFFDSLIFWDSKRPITVDLLRKIDFLQVARELGLESEFLECQSAKDAAPSRRITRKMRNSRENLELQWD